MAPTSKRQSIIHRLLTVATDFMQAGPKLVEPRVKVALNGVLMGVVAVALTRTSNTQCPDVMFVSALPGIALKGVGTEHELADVVDDDWK